MKIDIENIEAYLKRMTEILESIDASTKKNHPNPFEPFVLTEEDIDKEINLYRRDDEDNTG